MPLIKLDEYNIYSENFFTVMLANKSVFIAARIIMPETACVHINTTFVTVKDIFTGLELPPIGVANFLS